MPGSLPRSFPSAFDQLDCESLTAADVVKFHRSVFGDLRMSNDDPPAPPVPTPPVPTPPVPTPPAPRSLDDVIADLGLTPEQIAGRLEASKTWERRAKSDDRVDRTDYEAVRAERDRLKQANETETEKAVREAKEAGKAEARTEAVKDTVTALLRMGIKARGLTGDALDAALADLDTVNLSALADDKGVVDDDKIFRTINRLAGTAGTSAGPDTGQGNRGKGESRPSSVAQVMAARKAARDAK